MIMIVGGILLALFTLVVAPRLFVLTLIMLFAASQWECERARSYQVQHNPASAHDVSLCKEVDERMQEVGL